MGLGLPANLLGLIVSGDIGGYTIYTDRFGRKTVYPVSPPDKPASPLQLIQRNRFRDALTNWKAASQAVRDDWEASSLALGLCMTGLNMWLHFTLKGRLPALQTLNRQSGITLTMPPTVS